MQCPAFQVPVNGLCQEVACNACPDAQPTVYMSTGSGAKPANVSGCNAVSHVVYSQCSIAPQGDCNRLCFGWVGLKPIAPFLDALPLPVAVLLDSAEPLAGQELHTRQGQPNGRVPVHPECHCTAGRHSSDGVGRHRSLGRVGRPVIRPCRDPSPA